MRYDCLIPLHKICNEKFAALVLGNNKIALSKIDLMDGTINAIHSVPLQYDEYTLSPLRLSFYFSALDRKDQTIHFYRYKSTDFTNPQKTSISLEHFVGAIDITNSHIQSKLLYLDEQYVLYFITLNNLPIFNYDFILLVNIENGEVRTVNSSSPNGDLLLQVEALHKDKTVIKKWYCSLGQFRMIEDDPYMDHYNNFSNDTAPICFPYVMDLNQRKQGQEFILCDGELSYRLHLICKT